MPNVSLVVQSGPLQGQRLPLTRPHTVVGRSSDSDLVLENYTRVSRRHASFDWVGGMLYIQDEGSTNGVVVDQQRVQRAPLKAGSRIQLGDFEALVAWDSPQNVSPSPNPTPNPNLNPSPNLNSNPVAPASNSAAQQVSSLWQSVQTGWKNLPMTPRQKITAVTVVGLILVLGIIGMKGRPENDYQYSPSSPNSIAPADSDDLPTATDASKAPVAPGSTETVAAIDPVNGRIAPAAIQHVKEATVLIVHRTSNGYSMGSGFALGDARHIITNRHVVVGDDGSPQDCTIYFEAGTPRERKLDIEASNITLAPQTGANNEFQDDLAVINLPAGQTVALPAGKSESVTETDEVYAVGFPLGVETLTLNNDLPSVSVKTTRVERVETDKSGAVTVIQLGGSVTHGNSGGPVVNQRGEVVGVISSGVEGTGMAYAIPMTFVNSLLGNQATPGG